MANQQQYRTSPATISYSTLYIISVIPPCFRPRTPVAERSQNMLQEPQIPLYIRRTHTGPTSLGLGVMRIVRALQAIVKLISDLLATTVVRIATLPYYRLYQFNTRSPLQNIAKIASEIPPDEARLLRTLLSWRSRKTAELQFTTISCTVLAAAVIGAFSWTTVEEAHWLTHGMWHSSLILAVLGILLSASEVTVLYYLGPSTSIARLTPVQAKLLLQRYRPLLLSAMKNSDRPFIPRRKMMFTWQAPLMFMSYSVCTFLGGLTVLVCTPLIRYKHGDAWSAGQNIAVIYLTVFALSGMVFIFCSFWVYHYVDSALDGHEDFALEIVEGGNETNQSGFGTWLAPLGGSAPPGISVLHHRQRDGNEAAMAAEARERAHMENRLYQ